MQAPADPFFLKLTANLDGTAENQVKRDVHRELQNTAQYSCVQRMISYFCAENAQIQNDSHDSQKLKSHTYNKILPQIMGLSRTKRITKIQPLVRSQSLPKDLAPQFVF